MPRINRSNLNSLYLHVMVQGINKEKIFKNDYYKNKYLNYIVEEQKNKNVRCLVYVIINNHAHILIYYENIEDVSKLMNVVNSKFAKLYNKQNNRIGYVFRDRFKSKQIMNLKQLYNTISYIHYNPIKAGLVKNLEDYKFSSYKEFLNNKKNTKDIKLLFQTTNYKNTFFHIHRICEYNDILEEEGEEDYFDVIRGFLSKNEKNGINSIMEVTKNNDLLIQLVRELRERSNLKDTEIIRILKIGKNRIYNIMNKKF